MDSSISPSLLLLDNDMMVLAQLREHCAGQMEIRIDWGANLQEGLTKGQTEQYDIVLIHETIFGEDGVQTVSAFLAGDNPPDIVVYTDAGDADKVEEVLKLGIWDYLIDPSPVNLLPQMVQRILRYRRNKSEDKAVRKQEMRTQLEKRGIIGRSAVMQGCIDRMVRMAQSEGNVLIYGETGTGKELFASAIHSLSSRSKAEMTIVDCAALPPSLVESLLFGHVKGSFTGADRAQQGLIHQADGGTLFLDEIGELPVAAQKKLLRVIQERTYLPVGSTTERKSDFRLIAATNRDLKEMVEEGDFREDLLFRLKTFHLELPPLRDRTADIAELAYFCRDRFCKQHKLKKKRFSPDYLTLLTQYDWPGNVRELFQAVERSLSEAQESQVLHAKHVPPGIRIHAVKRKLQRQENDGDDRLGTVAHDHQNGELPSLKEARDQVIEQAEKAYLQKLLGRTGGDIKLSCELASISRSRFYDLLKKYGLVPGKTDSHPRD